jgi:hypothetical protein
MILDVIIDEIRISDESLWVGFGVRTAGRECSLIFDFNRTPTPPACIPKSR